METGKSKEKQGGSKEWEEEKQEDGIQDLCCRAQAAVVTKGSILPQHGWARVIHRGKAGRGYPRQQLGQDSLFVALPAVSCRMWSPAQTAAAQAVLPPTCSLKGGNWGTGKSSCVFPAQVPRRNERN